MSDRNVTCKGHEEKSSITDHNTSMTNIALVQNIVADVGGTSCSVTQTQNIVMQLTGPHYSFSSTQTTKIRCLEGFKETVTNERL